MLNKRKNNVAWLAAGLGLGALAGILFAPKAGCETRKAIAAGVDDGLKRAASFGREARRRVSNTLKSGTKFLARKKERVGAATDAVKVFVKKAS